MWKILIDFLFVIPYFLFYFFSQIIFVQRLVFNLQLSPFVEIIFSFCGLLLSLLIFYLCAFNFKREDFFMNLALIGYGKMGKEIEKIAVSRGHQINLIIDVNNPDDLTVENLRKCDVAIEFTIPHSAVNNYNICFEAGIPVVSGTTGWLDKKEEVLRKCKETNGTFFYASNFSLGVNLFFELNKKLAKLMASRNEYEFEMTEVHHIHKLDAPSGTAITLAEDILEMLPGKTGWVNDKTPAENELNIKSERRGEIPGIHTIKYESEVDFIEITHSSKSRRGLAFGAVLAAEYCIGRKGILTMKNLLNI
jgi:4-hydroxy-tetrahydrodipicolinate reductase